MAGFLSRLGQPGGTKTYKDRVYGISIEYPKSWKKKDGMREAVVLFMAPRTSPAQVFTANINITVQDLTGQDLTLDEYVHTTIEREKQFIADYELINIEPATMAGHPACQITFAGKQGYTPLRFIQLCTLKNHRAYAITCAAEAKEFPSFMVQARQVIDSLRIEER